MDMQMPGNIMNMTPIQPGAYVALYSYPGEDSQEFITEPVFAIAEYLWFVIEDSQDEHNGKWERRMAPVVRTEDAYLILAGATKCGGHSDDSAEWYAGLFTPEEAERKKLELMDEAATRALNPASA